MDAQNTHRLRVRSGWPVETVVLLVLLGVLLFCFQYITLEKFEILPAAVRYILRQSIVDEIVGQVNLDRTDAILAGSIVLVCFVLAILELLWRRLTVFLDQVLQTDRRTIWILGLASVVLVRFYFARGDINWAGDGSSHMCYAWLASKAFAQGEIPIWTNYLGTGSPYLQFYGFLFFYLVGVVDLFMGSVDVSVKLVLAGSHILSGIGMCLFVTRLCGSRRAGFLAGLVYVASLWHTQQTLMMGRFPLSIFYALMPWPFYCFERLRFQARQILPAMGGGFALGALAFTHPGYAFWATASLVLYMGVRICVESDRQTRWLMVWYGGALLGLGVVFGGYVTLSMWVERALVGLEHITHAAVPDPTWWQVLTWSNYRIVLYKYPGSEHWYGGYLGISAFGLALVGLAGTLGGRGRFPAAWAGGICWLVSLMLVFGYRWPVIRSLDVVKALNAGRYLLFVVFFMSVMAGVGVGVLGRWFRGSGNRVLALVLLVLLADLGPTTFQHPFNSHEKSLSIDNLPLDYVDILRTPSESFPKDMLPDYRYFYPTGRTFPLLVYAWFPVYTGIPGSMSGYREGTMSQDAFCSPLEQMLNRVYLEVSDPQQLDQAENYDLLFSGLYLLNTKYTCAFHPDEAHPSQKRVIHLVWKHRSPVVVAPRVEGRPSSRYVLQETRERVVLDLIRDMGVNYKEDWCEQIFLRGLTGAEDLGTSPRVKVLDHQVWNQKVALKIRLSEPGFVRLAYGYYPYLDVQVNGGSVEALETSERFIALKLEAGEHEIVLKPYLSLLRKGLLLLDIGLILAAMVVWWKVRQEGRLLG